MSFDKTQVECDINHVHIEDYLDTYTNIEKTQLEHGLLFGARLQELLSNFGQYMIIVGFSVEEIPDCTVRFHMKRMSENWLVEAINRYKEGIAVFD